MKCQIADRRVIGNCYSSNCKTKTQAIFPQKSTKLINNTRSCQSHARQADGYYGWMVVARAQTICHCPARFS